MEKSFFQKRWVRSFIVFIAAIILLNAVVYGMSMFLSMPSENAIGTIFGDISSQILMLVAMQPVVMLFSIIMAASMNPKWQFELGTNLVPWYKDIPLVHPNEYKRFKSNIFDKTPIEWKENFVWHDKFDIVNLSRMRLYSGFMVISRKTGITYLALEENAMPLIAKAKKGFVTGHFTFIQHGSHFGIKLIEEERTNEESAKGS